MSLISEVSEVDVRPASALSANSYRSRCQMMIVEQLVAGCRVLLQIIHKKLMIIYVLRAALSVVI